LVVISLQDLFSILGTIYGGDGRTTFALPDLRGRIPMHAGNGPGLSPRNLGQKFGTQTNTLNTLTMPSHNHMAVVGGEVKVGVSSAAADESSPDRNVLAETSPNNVFSGDGATGTSSLTGVTNGITVNLALTGNNQPINNMMPCQVINYIIAMQGTFPSRS